MCPNIQCDVFFFAFMEFMGKDLNRTLLPLPETVGHYGDYSEDFMIDYGCVENSPTANYQALSTG